MSVFNILNQKFLLENMTSSRSIDLGSKNECVVCGEIIEESEILVKLSLLRAKFMFHLPCYEFFLNKLLQKKYTRAEESLLDLDFKEVKEEIEIAEEMRLKDEVENICDLMTRDIINKTILISLDKLSFCPSINEYTTLKNCFKSSCQFEPAC